MLHAPAVNHCPFRQQGKYNIHLFILFNYLFKIYLLITTKILPKNNRHYIPWFYSRSSTYNGTCFSSSECSDKGGKSKGSCAAGWVDFYCKYHRKTTSLVNPFTLSKIQFHYKWYFISALVSAVSFFSTPKQELPSPTIHHTYKTQVCILIFIENSNVYNKNCT